MKRLSILFLCLFCHALFAQEYRVSLYEFTPVSVNPAGLSENNYAQISAVFREQESILNAGSSSVHLTGKYPVLQARNKILMSSILLSSTSEGIDGALKTDKVGVGISYSFQPNKINMVSFGLPPVIYNQRLNFDHLSTGTQFVEGLGFNPEIDNGESGHFDSWIIGYSLGAQWSKWTKKRVKKIEIGLSWQHNHYINIEQKLFGTLGLNSRYLLKSTRFWDFHGDLLYRTNIQQDRIFIGVTPTYKFPYYNKKFGRQSISIISRYSPGTAFNIGVRWVTEHWSVGSGYDLGVGERSGLQGAFEVAFDLRKRIRRKRPYKRRRGHHLTARKPSPRTRIQKELPNDSTEILTEEDSLEIDFDLDSLRAPYTKITLLDEYAFGEVEPNFNVLDILDELIYLLQTEGFSSLEIIGHTDNVGSDPYNQALSEDRARIIFETLVSYGIEEGKMSFIGKGESEPLNDNSTSGLRKLNRRVEIIVYHE